MNRNLFNITFALGALTIVWVGSGFVGNNFLALSMTLLIAAAYGVGAYELLHFRRATASLNAALVNPPDTQIALAQWIGTLPPELQNAVRLRIDGERSGLPAPSLTPFLIGLLVMLGMLGTFVGMVVTLNGAVFALEGTTDLQAIRAALAAPIKGLGLAFGTSVAGVAASATLGLMSTLCRRERHETSQLLDARIADRMRSFSHAHQRQESYKALQAQAQALPQLFEQLQAMMELMDRREQQLGSSLLEKQRAFHAETRVIYNDLATSVAGALRDSLGESARVAGASIKPIVESAMSAIAEDARTMHAHAIDSAQTQLQELSARFGATAEAVADKWRTALASHERVNDHLLSGLGRSLDGFSANFQQSSGALLTLMTERMSAWQAEQAASDTTRLAAWQRSLESTASSTQSELQQARQQAFAQHQAICVALERTADDLCAQLQASAGTTIAELTRLTHASEKLLQARLAADETRDQQQVDRMDQMVSLWTTELATLRREEAERGEAAVNRLGELQSALTRHLSTLGAALEEPINRLMQSASDAPRAAAEVITQLRHEISHSMARDNEVLEERGRILATLNSLLQSIDQTSAQQREAITSLVTSSAELLDRVGVRFAEQIGTESARLADVTAQVNSSAIEVASLSDAFTHAVQLFNDSNEKLVANLQGIEASLDKSMQRSDEQLAYYVAQAREIIDLSLMSQKGVVEDLRRLADKAVLATNGVG